MEHFLECYLDDFKDAPRNSLYDRRNRQQMVEYISTMIQGCSAVDDNIETTCKDAITTLIRFHKKAKTANGTVCMMGKYHNILYVAMKLCYLWQIKDADLVCDLLNEIYLCEHSFERIIIGAIFGTKAPHYIAGWKSDFDNQEENVRGLVYFIDKANHGKLEFSSFEKENHVFRFIDLPIESCGKSPALKISLQLGLPDKLIILLRFGAVIPIDVEETTILEHVLNRLLEFNHCYPYNLVACLQLLLRVVPMIKINMFHSGLDMIENKMSLVDLMAEKYKDLIEDGLLPLSRCGYVPPELKHLSRCAIRRRLWENFQLPHGIRSLPLPEQLWKYIDILID